MRDGEFGFGEYLFILVICLAFLYLVIGSLAQAGCWGAGYQYSDVGRDGVTCQHWGEQPVNLFDEWGERYER